MPKHKLKTQLSREQSDTLFRIFKKKYDEGKITHPVNNDVIGHIMEVGPDHDPEFEEALHHVAYGNLDKVDDMLNNNPHLLLQAGTVVTPSGLTVKRTTLLECALGAGDPEMADIMLSYFDYIEEGEEVKQSQLERFRPHIEGMMALNYDLTVLFEIIQAASDEDVKQALNKNFDHDSDLNQVLQAFREALRPTEIVNGMHYAHYATLAQALEKLANRRVWNASKYTGPNDRKTLLVWRQVIGYLQIGLPAAERFEFASEALEQSERSYQLKKPTPHRFFPGVGIDSGAPSDSSLGFDFAIFDGKMWAVWMPCDNERSGFYLAAHQLSKHLSNKNSKLTELIQQAQNPQSCVIL